MNKLRKFFGYLGLKSENNTIPVEDKTTKRINHCLDVCFDKNAEVNETINVDLNLIREAIGNINTNDESAMLTTVEEGLALRGKLELDEIDSSDKSVRLFVHKEVTLGQAALLGLVGDSVKGSDFVEFCNRYKLLIENGADRYYARKHLFSLLDKAHRRKEEVKKSIATKAKKPILEF